MALIFNRDAISSGADTTEGIKIKRGSSFCFNVHIYMQQLEMFCVNFSRLLFTIYST